MQKLFLEIKRLVLNPVEAVTNSVETFSTWRASRRWSSILPAIPFALALVGLLLYLMIRVSAAENELVNGYFASADSAFPVSKLETLLYRDVVKLNTPKAIKDNANSASEPEEVVASDESALERPSDAVLDKMKLTLDRVKQIAPDNNEATYRMAVIDALQGRRELADEAIKKLAESTGIPMLAAYHWHAINLLNKKMSGEVVVDAELDRVLARAVEWRSVRPDLQSAAGFRLLSQKKIDRALELLLASAEHYPGRYLFTARLAKENNRESTFQQATERAEKYYGARIDTASEKPRDRIAFAEIQLLKDRKDAAIERLQAGIKNSEVQHPELSIALSNVYLQEYETKMKGKSVDQITSDAFNELMMAIKSAPTNPNLGTPAVFLLMNNKKLPDAAVKALQDLLKDQLRANVATPETLMILGSLYYQKKLYKEADSAWQKVLALNPNAVHALNNLAVLEFELPEPNAERALERIQKAYELAPGNVEICDSYGQVLVKLNRPREAISKFESALRNSPAPRPKTREMLAKCYADIGQKEISDAQIKFVSAIADKAAQKTDPASDDSKTEPAATNAAAPSNKGAAANPASSTTPPAKTN